LCAPHAQELHAKLSAKQDSLTAKEGQVLQLREQMTGLEAMLAEPGSVWDREDNSPSPGAGNGHVICPKVGQSIGRLFFLCFSFIIDDTSPILHKDLWCLVVVPVCHAHFKKACSEKYNITHRY
jgi:hypothetical protein